LWLVDGPSESVAVAFGSSFEQWRQALLLAAGAEPDWPPAGA